MAYTPFQWHDGPGGGTPIIATRLNAIEQGVSDAHDVTDLVAPLGPHVQALLDGRIVEDNLDVPQFPSNIQRYIRYSNGVQVIFSRQYWHGIFDYQSGDGYTRYLAYIPHIAEFSDTPWVTSLGVTRLDYIANPWFNPLMVRPDLVSTTGNVSGFIVDALGSAPEDDGVGLEYITFMAIGPWEEEE